MDGTVYSRAVQLAREAATSAVHGGPAGEGALEFVLSEAANDRLGGVSLALVLARLSASLAVAAASLELDDGTGADPDADLILGHAVGLIDELLDAAAQITLGSGPSR
jgi:hypothetical protein